MILLSTNLVRCDNDSTYIPTSEEVYDSIDQNRLFADDENDDSTVSNEFSAFLGMVLTEDTDDTDDFDSDSFDETDEINIILSALYQAARASTSSPASAKNWFEAVDVKFDIAGICNALTYTDIYAASGARGINTRLLTSVVNQCLSVLYK